MTRSYLLFGFCCLVFVNLNSQCFGGFDVQPGNTIKLTDGSGNSGGIFHVDVNPISSAGLDFDTFCVEVIQTIHLGTEYYVESIGTSTSADTNRVLTSKVAWLYTKFDTNTLPGIGTTPLTNEQADAVQYGIWRELSWGGSPPGYTPTQITDLPGVWDGAYLTYLTNKYLNAWFAAHDADTNWAWDINASNVQIMRLRKFEVNSSGPITLADGRTIKLKTEAVQDQLFRIPPPQSVVPELSTFCMAGSIVFVAVLRGLVSGHRQRESGASIN